MLAQAKVEGAVAALSKPIDRDALLSAVEDAIGSA
jgi:FixJ family two-component response regulator